MKKSNFGKIALIVLAAILLIGIVIYNGLVSSDNNVNKKWADVQGAYQRRADLIPNLVNTVKGYADHEQQTLIGVVEARAKATQVTIDPTNLDENTLAQYQKAQDEIGSTLSRLLVSVEQYPDLKANQNFLELQSQLEGTENRINVERNNYNEAVRLYSNKIRRFPTNLLANMFGFEPKPFFESKPGAENAPEVDLGKNK